MKNVYFKVWKEAPDAPKETMRVNECGNFLIFLKYVNII
jgi:hypothetical protein